MAADAMGIYTSILHGGVCHWHPRRRKTVTAILCICGDAFASCFLYPSRSTARLSGTGCNSLAGYEALHRECAGCFLLEFQVFSTSYQQGLSCP